MAYTGYSIHEFGMSHVLCCLAVGFCSGLGHHTTLLTMQLDKIIRFLSTIFPFMNVSLFLDSYFKFVVNHVISIYHGASTQWKLKLGNFTSPPMWEREF